jgi:hypothetical protein
LVGLVVAGAALALLAACGGGGQAEAGGEWLAPAPSASAPASAPVRVKKINSACKLLPAKKVTEVLGSSSKTTLEARELPVDKSGGEIAYTCAYGRGGQEPFALTVSTRPEDAASAKDRIGNIGRGIGVKTTPVTDLGDAGVGYVKDGTRVIVVALAYEKDLRLVFFAAPQIVPQTKMVEVAEQVVTQI